MSDTTIRTSKHTQYSIVTENITAYMKDIDDIPRITITREKELANLIHNGETDEIKQKARTELICSNLKLVVKIAHDFKRYGMTFADIVAEGNCGLMMAVDRYDPTKGAKFSCYAAWWIKQSIRKAIINQTRTVRIPSSCAQKALKLQKIKDAFANETGRDASDAELIQAAGISARALAGLKYAEIQTYSIDELVSADSETTFGDMLTQEPDYTESSTETTTRSSDITRILHMLSDLSALERFVVQHTFGVGQHDTLETCVICQETGLTQTQLNTVLSGAIEKLRNTASKS